MTVTDNTTLSLTTNGHHVTTLTAHQQPQHDQKIEIPEEHNKLQYAIHAWDAQDGTLIDYFKKTIVGNLSEQKSNISFR